MGNIKWKSIHVDSAEYNGKPLAVIKAYWEEFELGSIYLARIYAGSMYLALIQTYSHHTYGSVFIMSYGLPKPMYVRLVNNIWQEQEQLISNRDLTNVVKTTKSLDGKNVHILTGALNETQNYLQIFVDTVDLGYIIFDVSRNLQSDKNY